MASICNLCLKLRVQVVKKGRSQKFHRAQCALAELIHNADNLHIICFPCCAKLEGLITFKRYIQHNIQVKKRKQPPPPDVHDYATKKVKFEIQTGAVPQTVPKFNTTLNTASLNSFATAATEKVTTSFTTTSTTTSKTVTSSLTAASVLTTTASAVTARASPVSTTALKALTSSLTAPSVLTTTASTVSARVSNASTKTSKTVTSSLTAASVLTTAASTVSARASPVSATTPITVTSSFSAPSVLTTTASAVTARASTTTTSSFSAPSVLTTTASTVSARASSASTTTSKTVTSSFTAASVLPTAASTRASPASTTSVSATQPTAKAKFLVIEKPRDTLHQSLPTIAPTNVATCTVTESESVTAKDHVDHCYAEMNNCGIKEWPSWKKKSVAMPINEEEQKEIIDVVRQAISMLAESKNSVLFNIAPGVSDETVFSDTYAELKRNVPFLFDLLNEVVGNNGNKPATIALIYSMIVNSRNKHASAIQRILTILAVKCHADGELLAKLNRLHVTLSERSKGNIMKDLKHQEYLQKKNKEEDEVQIVEPPPDAALFSSGYSPFQGMLL